MEEVKMSLFTQEMSEYAEYPEISTLKLIESF